MIDFGSLDRACKLYARTASAGVGGVVVYAYPFRRNFPATLKGAALRTPNAEQSVNGMRVASVGMPVYRTRYIPEMTTGMRVTTEGRTYQVVRCDPLGRREGWDLYLEDVR